MPRLILTDIFSSISRTRLPAPMVTTNEVSLWSILKNCIGKELSKITMPVIFNEPLSFLQRITENGEYAHLLEEANMSDDPLERMEVRMVDSHCLDANVLTVLSCTNCTLVY